ncbi:MAG: T9SS type A sorting domain-containing protein [Chitinophagaceae bacterium]|nr:T9SS type A sorting domain-containing protein [Chitinophagaceae bacterium]
MKKLLTILIILLAAGLTSSRAQNTWTQKANFGGVARSAAVGFSIGDKGYIGTGYNGSMLNDFWEYDVTSDVWTQKANYGGTKMHGGAGFSIGNKGYIGIGGGNSIFYKDFWEYDPTTNTWTKKADFGGSARYAVINFTIGNKGYVGTGFNGQYLKDFWEYDPATDLWTQKADFGGGKRIFAASFSIGTKGYAGTGQAEGVTLVKDFWEYNPSADLWTKKADFGGTARLFAAGFSIGNKGFMGTGSYSYYKDFWEYDPAIDNWTQKADYGGGGVYAPVGFSINGKGYLGTGENGAGYKGFWEYTPEINNALDFDGVDDYVLTPGTFGGPAWKELTVEAWVYCDAITDYFQAVYGSNEWPEGTWVHLQMESGGNNAIFSNKGWIGLPIIPQTAGVWKHVALVAKSGDSRIYENGIQLGATVTTQFQYILASNTINIGRGYNSVRHMNGKIDELRVWNVARTQAEIQANMNVKICGNTSGLFAYYPFDQGISGADNSGLVIADDLSDNNNDGTLNNFALSGTNSNWVDGAPGLMNDNCEVTDCAIPSMPTVSSITSTSAQFNWDNLPTALGYVIKYNTQDGSGTAKVTYSKSNSKPISGLTPNTTYFWRVKSVCSEDPKVVSEWSEKYFFTTHPFKIGDVQSNSLTIYPNPVSQQFTLNIESGSTTNQSASIHLLNVLGQTIYSSQEIVNGELTKVITMPGTAASGWYLVRVVMSDQVIENRLLYQK